MDTYDLETAFYRRLTVLTYQNLTTLRPDQIFDPETAATQVSFRRGQVLLNEPDTIAFGHGVYSRIECIYQIDLWVPRANYDALGDGAGALKQIKNMSDAHLAHFFPANGRGLALTENSTTAAIVRRPTQRHMGREGAYLREIIEVNFYTDVPPSA